MQRQERLRDRAQHGGLSLSSRALRESCGEDGNDDEGTTSENPGLELHGQVPIPPPLRYFGIDVPRYLELPVSRRSGTKQGVKKESLVAGQRAY